MSGKANFIEGQLPRYNASADVTRYLALRSDQRSDKDDVGMRGKASDYQELFH